MKTQLINQDKSESKNLSLNEAIFGSSVNEALVHEVVTSYMSNSRLATRGHKNRSAASGGGAKPWRQKGTGRARAGTTEVLYGLEAVKHIRQTIGHIQKK